MNNADKIIKMKKELSETGGFYIEELEGEKSGLHEVLPGIEHLGSITDILGYEPDNYHLLAAYQLDDKIYTLIDAGNNWDRIGLLDESDKEGADFAAEIRAGVQRMNILSSMPFDEEGSLNDMHDPERWTDRKGENSD